MNTDPRNDYPPWFQDHLVRAAWVFLVLGTILRVGTWLLNFPIWGDEAFVAMNVLDHDYAGLMGHLDHHQIAPLLFLWIERAFANLLGHSEMSLRLYPLLCGVGSLFVFWNLARRTVPFIPAVAALGFLSAAYWPTFLSATIKPYAPDLFWSLVLLRLGWSWIEHPERVAKGLFLSLLAGVVLWGSYPVVFVAGAISLTLLPALRQSSWAFRGTWLLFNLMVGASFFSHYWVIGRAQVGEEASLVHEFYLRYWENGFPPSSLADWPMWFLKVNTGRMFAYPLGEKNFGSTFTTLLFLIGCVALWKRGYRKLLVVLLIPFLLNLIAAILKKYPYGACCRLSQHVAASVCIGAGMGLTVIAEQMTSTWRGRLILSRINAGIFASIAMLLLILAANKPFYNTEAEWTRKVARELKRHVEPGDTIIVRNPRSEVWPMLTWALEKEHHPFWNGERPEQSPGRIWIVNTWIDADTDNHWRDVEQYINTHYRTWKFVGRSRYALPPRVGLRNPVFQVEIALFDPEGVNSLPPIFNVWP